jgi:hypothetical protein
MAVRRKNVAYLVIVTRSNFRIKIKNTTKESAMSNEDYSSNNALPHQLFHGTTWHSRLLPSVNKFVYPYRYWGVNISALAAGQALPEVSKNIFSKNSLTKKLPLQGLLAKGLPLFSANKKALQQFCPDDYLQKLEGLSSNEDNDNDGTNSNII